MEVLCSHSIMFLQNNIYEHLYAYIWHVSNCNMKVLIVLDIQYSTSWTLIHAITQIWTIWRNSKDVNYALCIVHPTKYHIYISCRCEYNTYYFILTQSQSALYATMHMCKKWDFYWGDTMYVLLLGWSVTCLLRLKLCCCLICKLKAVNR